MVPVALVAAVGSTAAMVALAASARTANAYDDYLERAEVAHVVINPAIHTREIDTAIRTLPGVERVATDYLLSVTIDDGAPRTRQELETPVQLSSYASAAGDRPGTWDYAEEIPDDLKPFVVFFGSPDGGHVDVGRPVVVSGRLATGDNEVVLNVAAAESTGFQVGDVIPLVFWEGTFSDSAIEGDYEQYLAEVVAPLSTERAEVVGIVILSDEVLPDGLYPRERAILSADLTARYLCPPVDVALATATVDEAFAGMLGAPCASNYPYYWLSMANGAAGVPAALDEFVRRAAVLSPPRFDVDGSADEVEVPQYDLLSTETEQRADQVRRSIQPTVAALLVLGLAAAVVAAALVVLAAIRELRSTGSDQRQWHELGIEGRARALVVVAPVLAATTAGVVVGLVAGWLLDTGPVGMVAKIEPDPARRFSGFGALVVTGIGVAAIAGIALVAVRTTRRSGKVIPPPARARRRGPGRSFGSPAVTHGVRAAYGQRASIPVVAGMALVVGTLVATSVFAASMSKLVDTPRSYGWPWDLGAMHGFGYGGVDLEAMAGALDEDPDVAEWTALAFRTGISLNGRPLPAVVGYDRTTDVDLPLVAGTLPTAADEVAVGQTFAREAGVAVGDTVELQSTDSVAWRATVTGIVVLPTLGQFRAEPTLPGSGAVLPEGAIPPQEALWSASFIGVKLQPGTDSIARARVLAQISRTDPNGVDVSLAYPSAVRPPAIVDARSTLAVPVAVGIAFTVIGTLALLAAAWASTRARRHELAILRTFGFSSWQVRWSIRAQSAATMLAALAVAVPAGVIVGRSLWRVFARQLGVLPEPAGSWALVSAVVLGGLVLSVLAAEVPARVAARAMPAAGLRTE